MEKGKTSKKSPKNTSKKVEKKESFLDGVKKEMKNVRWPLKKEMAKYSVAALSFIVFFGLYFTLIILFLQVLIEKYYQNPIRGIQGVILSE